MKILATAKACMQLPRRRHFVRRENNSMCFEKTLPFVVEVYAQRGLQPEFNLIGNNEVEKSLKIYTQALEAIWLSGRGYSWGVSASFIAMQTVSMQIMHFVGNM